MADNCTPKFRTSPNAGCPSIRVAPVDEWSTILKEHILTVQTNAQGATADYVYNNRVRIYCDDGNAYTLAERNKALIDAEFDVSALPAPLGYCFTKRDGTNEVIYAEPCTDQVYNFDGTSPGTAGTLAHSPYNTAVCFTAGSSGTDAVTGKGWAVEVDGDYLLLKESNTGTAFQIANHLPYTNALQDIDDFEERTMALYYVTEWYRHRFAIDSELDTTEADGTMTTVEILNANGTQPAVGEDMYFWIGGVNTGKLAKYNLNNLHSGAASGGFTAALAQTVYDAQKAKGINMNDTGVNSDTIHLLGDGSKGAEAIAVGGFWYIITPYVTNATAAARFGDAPAVYWAVKRGLSLPSMDGIEMWYFNKAMVNGLRNYLNDVEGQGLPALPNGTVWSSGRSSATNAWYVYTSNGYRNYGSTANRYYVVGASGLL